MMKDPVCGVNLDVEEAVGISEFQEGTFYFCSSICKEKFDANPILYVEYAAVNSSR